MQGIFQALATLVIALSVLLFFGPIIVIISIVGNVDIGPLKIDLTNRSSWARVAMAIVGLGTWFLLYIPLVLLTFRAVPSIISQGTSVSTALPLSTIATKSHLTNTPIPSSIRTTVVTKSATIPIATLTSPSLEPTRTVTTYVAPGTTNITPNNRARQSFVLQDSKLWAVEVYIKCLNPGKGDDSITMKILAEDETILAATSQLVRDGFEGWLQFDLSRDALELEPNQVLFIELVDTGKAIFGWSYERDRYPDGIATFRSSDPDLDFLFRVNQ